MHNKLQYPYFCSKVYATFNNKDNIITQQTIIMKKALLLLSFILLGFCAYAQQNIVSKFTNTLQAQSIQGRTITHHKVTPAVAERLKSLSKAPRRAGSISSPTVKPQTYAMSGYFFTYSGMAYASGIAQQVAIEEDKVYISNMFPIMLENREAWTVGDLNADGTVITIPVQHVYDEDWYSVGTDEEFYMGDIIFDEEANIVDVRPFELCKDGDLIYIDDLKEVDENGYAVVNHHIGLFTYGESATDIQLYDYVAGVKFTPYATGDLVECPADARVEEYVYRSLNDYGDPVTHQLQVAFKDNDIYFNGLTPDMPNWVHGTLDDKNIVSIPSNQYVGIMKYFYIYFAALSVAGQDKNGNANFNVVDNLQLTYDPETGNFTYADRNVYIGELIFTGGTNRAVFTAYGEMTISPLGQAKAATPSAPYEVYVMDLEDYGYEQWDFGFQLDNKGVNDEYLHPEGLKAYMFMDDNLFTFSPDEYMIDAPIYCIAYDEADSNDAFYHEDSVFDFYINKDRSFKRLGVVAAYTAEGETNYSEIAYIDMDTMEVTYDDLTSEQLAQLNGGNNDAIQHVTLEGVAPRHYDLYGRRVSPNAPGFHIIVK